MISILLASLAVAFVSNAGGYRSACRISSSSESAAVAAVLALLWLVPALRIHLVPLADAPPRRPRQCGVSFWDVLHRTARPHGRADLRFMTERCRSHRGCRHQQPRRYCGRAIRDLTAQRIRTGWRTASFQTIGSVRPFWRYFPIARQRSELGDRLIEIRIRASCAQPGQEKTGAVFALLPRGDYG